MNINLTSKRGELPLSDHFPDPSAGFLFPGAEIKIAQNYREDYYYLIQQFKTLFFTIRYCSFYSVEKDVLTVTNAPGVIFRLGISNSHQVMTTDLGNQVFHERGYNLFCNPGESAEYIMEPGETFIFLDLLLENDYLDYLHYYYPVTKDFIEKAAKGIAGKLTLSNQVALTETWRWQEELMDWCFDANRTSSDGDIIGNKLIVKSIEAAKPATAKRGIALTLPEMNRICNAAEMIRNSDETPVIEILSAGSGLSVYKFNAGFKEIFGHPVGKHKFEDKMSYALRLMDCKGADLKQVATLLGYSQPRAFLQDFRKRFGYAPFEKDKPAQ
jgi:AraC-like DNA-binding protein